MGGLRGALLWYVMVMLVLVSCGASTSGVSAGNGYGALPATSAPATVTPSPGPARTRAVPAGSRTAAVAPSPRVTRPSVGRSPRPVSSPPPSRSPRPTPTAAAGVTHVIHLGGYAFSPSTLTIAVGDSVRAVVDDGSHTFTGTAGPKTWDSGGLSAGDSYTVRLTSPGDYSFVCSYHQTLGMTGSVHVQ